MDAEAILARIEATGDPTNVDGMARFGIRPDVTVYGVSMTELRRIAKEIGKDHALAQQLWECNVHEGRLLATIIADPKQITESQMEQWAATFDSWDIVDQCMINCFRKTPFAYDKAFAWSKREEEFVKRAAFALMATLAVHDKKAPDEKLLQFLAVIERESDDDRNFVKKAVNWALRQIGKRNLSLNAAAIETAERIQQRDSKAARWTASNALRELISDKVQDKLHSQG